jgi:hypothetical protein
LISLKNVIGIVCADGHHRHIIVGIGGRWHMPYGRRHRFSRRHSYRPTTMMSRQNSNAAGTGNLIYFLKMIFQKNKKIVIFIFFEFFLPLISLKSL